MALGLIGTLTMDAIHVCFEIATESEGLATKWTHKVSLSFMDCPEKHIINKLILILCDFSRFTY